MQDLFLESFSYELQLDMHSYLHKNFILAKSGCYTPSTSAFSQIEHRDSNQKKTLPSPIS
jgi:hypothetical protein